MQQFDYIITGAGSAGCILASRLTEDPDVTVLLLEAGGRDRNILFHWPAGFAKMTKGIASWGWETVPQRNMNDRVLWYTQAKVIGGGSSINAQVYTRGNAVDYDAWRDHAHCEGWGYREVLPYFKRSEGNQVFCDDYHGAEGPLGVSQPVAPLPVAWAFIRAAQQYGIPYNPDFNGARQAGAGFYQLTQRDARRSSASTAFLKPAMNRPNLTVMTGAQALKIITENGRAVGVDYTAGGGIQTARASREVLVTSGAIGSPRLLLLSGIGPAAHLKSAGISVVHDLPGVGENLHDHLDLFVIAECAGRYSYDHYGKWYHAMRAGVQYLLFRNGPVASSLFETGAFWRSEPGDGPCDLQFHFGQGSGIEAGVASMQQGGVTLNAAYMRPKSRGTVRLKSSDPADAPLIDPNYWREPEDRQRHIEGFKIARDIMRQPALQPFLKAERLPGPDVRSDADLFEYACANAKTQHHPVGTCKMGTDDMAVVDAELKVRGIEGLRVCDSSIMPTINSSNTNAPTLMIGEKASDLVRGLPPLPPAIFDYERNEPRQKSAGTPGVGQGAMFTTYGLQHIGFTVPDMEEAVTFLTELFGAVTVMECGAVDVDDAFMLTRLGVPDGCKITDQRVLQVGKGGALELFEYSGAPGPHTLKHNGEVGAMHIAFEVDDAYTAAKRMREAGVDVLEGPTLIEGGPMDGLVWLYLRAPWGQYFEVVSADRPLGYEADGGPKMYSPKA